MSYSRHPTLPWALPLYDMMRTDLEKHAKNMSLPIELRKAANAGYVKLMKYFDAAQKNHYNMIATSTFTLF